MSHSVSSNRLPHKPVVLIAVAAALSLFGDMALYAILPIHFRALGLIPLQVGVLLSANRWIRLLTNHLAEKLSGKIDNSILLLAALITGSVLAVLYGIMPPFWLFLTGRLVWGFSWSVIRQIGIMTSVNLSEIDSVGRTIGLYKGITQLGSMAGILLAGILFDVGGFSRTLFIVAGISLTAVPFGYMGYKIVPVDIKRRAVSIKRKKRSISPSFIMQSMIVGCIGRGVVMSTLGYILVQKVGENITFKDVVIGVATINGVILASKNIINSVLSPLLGTMSDYLGNKKSLTLFFFFGAISMSLSVITMSLFPLILLLLIFFISDTALQISLSTIAAKKGPEAYASMATGFDFGAAVGPLLSWALVEFFSTPVLSFPLGAVLYSAGFALSLFRKKRE
ncbi:MAG: MFS transporter [Spirochaetales bacterium]|nr:MFS transporter [Spirochaetales bacterium]